MSFKRILALVLALTMCFSIVFPGGVAFAEKPGENTTGESSESIPITTHEHVWVVDSNTASCTQAGIISSHCSGCTETKTEDAPALGHDLVYHAASEDDVNLEYWQCSRCNKYFSDVNGEHEISIITGSGEPAGGDDPFADDDGIGGDVNSGSITGGGEGMSSDGLTITAVTTQLTVNGTTQLSAECESENVDMSKVEWTFDNENVVTVDETGLVTAIGAGEVKIHGCYADNNGEEFEGDITITVTAAPANVYVVQTTDGKLEYDVKSETEVDQAENEAGLVLTTEADAQAKVLALAKAAVVPEGFSAAVYNADASYFTGLNAAVNAVSASGKIVMLADEAVTFSGYALTIAAGKNLVLDLNGHTVVGQCTAEGTSALIRNLGNLTINDSSDPSTGKLSLGADPTWTWDGSDNYAGSYASNLIRNERTLVVNSGTLYNASTGSAAYAIDNYSAGKVTINGGTIDAKKACAIRMFYNNGGTVTINGGVVGGETCYMGVQVMGGNDAKLSITNGTIGGSYSVYSSGGGTSSVTISGGTFNAVVGVAAACPAISVSGGEFKDWVGSWGSHTGFISGGLFDVKPDAEYIAEGYQAIEQTNGKWKVCKVEQTAPAQTAENPNEYTVTNTVKDGETTLFTQTVTVEIVGVEQGANSAAATSPSQVQADKVIEKSLEAASIPTTEEAVTVEIELVVKAAGAGAENWGEIVHNDNDVLVEAHPEAIIKVNGTASDPITLENSDLAQGASFSFGLPVTLAEGTLVSVTHYKEDGTTENYTSIVSNGKVPVTVSSFSLFQISEITPAANMVAVNLGPSAKGGTQYATLAEAISDATAGDTIALLANIDEGAINVPKNLVIDLNGHNVTGTEYAFQANDYKTLTIQGSGTVTGVFDAVTAGKSATLYLNGGTYSAPTAVSLGSGATAYVDGATLNGVNYGIQTDSNASNIYVISGSVSASAEDADAISSNGTVRISSGTVSGYKALNNFDQKKDEISGGTIIGMLDSNPLNSNTRISVTGGNFTVDPDGYVADNKISWKNAENDYSILDAVTVTLNANGGTLKSESSYKAAKGKTFNETIANKEYVITDPTRSAYSFLGWNTDSSATAADPSAFTTALSTNVTLYAVWKEAVASFTDSTGVVRYFNSVKDAIAEVESNPLVATTITLHKNSDELAESPIEIVNKNLVLDLNGNTLSARINLKSGNLTVKNGTLSNPETTSPTYGQALNVYGSGDSAASGYVNLTVDSDVTINAAYAVCLFGPEGSATKSYGATVNFNGTANCTKGAIFVSGNIGNATGAMAATDTNISVINIGSSASVTSSADQALAMNGMAKVVVSAGAQLTGREAIGLKRGVLVVNGGTFTATGAHVDPAAANNNGTEATGAALSVTSTYNNYGSISATINGGTFTSASNAALYVGHSKNGAASVGYNDVELDVNNGSFNGGTYESIAQPAVYVADALSTTEAMPEQFIDGGSFSKQLEVNYCGPNLIPSDADPVTGRYTVETGWKVSFDADNGTAVEYVGVKNNETVQRPTDPTKTDFTFVDWFNGDTKFVFTTPITADLPLKAVWTADLVYSVSLGTDPWTYGDAARVPVPGAKAGTTVVTDFGEPTYHYDGTGTTTYSSNDQPTAAGTYRLTASFPKTAQYTAGTAEVEFSIEKKAINPTVTIADWIAGNGVTELPTVTGNTGNGALTYEYKATEGESTYAEFTVDGSKTIPAGAYTLNVTVAETANYKSGTAEDTFTVTAAVAKIGETYYASLAAAVAAAQSGETIVMVADDNVSLTDGSELEINKSLTIDGDDHTIYGKSTVTGTNDIFITGSGNVTIKDVTITGFGNEATTDPNHAPVYVSTNFTGNVNLSNVYVSDFNRGGIFLYGGNFTVDYCDIDCANSRSGAFTKGIEIKGSASGTISNTNIYNMERSSTTYSTAGIELYGNGTVVVDNCYIQSNSGTHTTTKGTYGIVSSRVGVHDPSGGSLQVKNTVIDVTNAALSISDSTEFGPVNDYEITVDNSTFTNYIAMWSDSEITINSGIYAKDVYADAGTIYIKGGNFTSFEPDTGEDGTIAVSGGTFDAEVPLEYCADGYIPSDRDPSTGKYTVEEGATITFVNYDGTQLQKTNVANGGEVAYTRADPVRPDTSSYVYTWTGWTDGTTSYGTTATFPAATTTDVTYTAVFTSAATVASITRGDPEAVYYYSSLKDAIEDAADGNTIVVLNGTAVTSTISISDGRALTLDLNGQKVTSSIATTFKLTKGTLTVTDTATTNGGIEVSGEAFRVDGTANANKADAILNIESGVNVTSDEDCCVYIRGYATLNTAGNLESKGDYATIQGNGNLSNAGTDITISGGAVKGVETAVYVPQNNSMTISGGTITAQTAVYHKSGSLSITGGTLNGTGDKADYTYNGSGCNATGDALVIDNCGYPGGDPTVAVTGGTFISTNAQPIGSYAYGQVSGTAREPVEKFVSAGETTAPSFNKQLPLKYCATGYMPSPYNATTQLYGVEHSTAVAMIENAGADTQYFVSIAAALTEAATHNGEAGVTTVKLLGSEISEEVVFPATLKGVTITSADPAKPVTIKNGSFNSNTAGSVDYENISITYLNFDNSNILFSGGRNGVVHKDWTIDHCQFTDISGKAAVAFSPYNAGKYMENFTFTNNVIDGVTGGTFSGLMVGASKGTVTIEDNTITNVAWNAIQFLNAVSGTTVTIRKNTLSSAAYEGVLNVFGCYADNMTISGNNIVNTNESSDVAIAYAGNLQFADESKRPLDVSDNYFGVGRPVLDPNLTVTSIYTDTITSSSEPVSIVAKKTVYSGETVTGYKYYPTLAEAIADAAAGDTVTLLANVTLSEGLDIAKKITLDLNGKTITNASTYSQDYLIGVKRGAELTVQDSSNPSTGAITTDTSSVYCGIKVTLTGENDATTPAKLNVVSGAITGYYYAISGNGSRHNTEITVSGGTLTGTNGTAIYQPQDGKLTISGGSFTGGETGIEVRSGTLKVTGGSFTSTANEYSCNPNGSSTTTVGAAIAIAQHTTNKAIDATINGESIALSAVKPISIQNPQNNAFNNVTVKSSVTEGTVIPDGYYWKTNGDGTSSLTKAVATVTVGSTTTSFDSLADAFTFANSKGNAKVTLLENVKLASAIDVEATVIFDLNGKTVTDDTGFAQDYLIGVKRGAILTIDDSSNPSTGAITTEDVMCGVKVTLYGEAASGTVATLNVLSGSITGESFGISGNGSRHNTAITVSGGTLTGTNGSAIYHPQDGTLTISGGSFTGGETGIEVRSGTLNVTGGSFTSTAEEYSCNPNGSGTTTVGAAIAIAQHTTNKPINATINVPAEKLIGVKPISIQNPEQNEFENVAVASSVTDNAVIPEGYYWKPDTETGLYTLAYAVATVKVGTEDPVPFDDFADAWSYANTNGGTLTMLEPYDTAAQLEASGSFTLDFNGNSLQYIGTQMLPSGVIIVLRGAHLTVKDTGDNAGFGGIIGDVMSYYVSDDPEDVITSDDIIELYGNISYAYAAIALTKAGETSTEDAVLTVLGGELYGHYYGICGNGSRHGTQITVSGGSIIGAEGSGIYHPQDGTLTISGGKFIGGETGIEVRSGTLNVTGGTFETQSANYSCDPNGSGTTTVGAAIAIAQHTTNKQIDATISGANYVVPTGGDAVMVSVQNPQNNTFENVAVASSVVDSSKIPDGYYWKLNTDTSLYSLTKAIATVTYTEGGDEKVDYFDSITDAFACANAKYGTVKLLENVTLTNTDDLLVRGTVTLDLNGKTLTNGDNAFVSPHDYLVAVMRGGNLTIVDNSANGGGAITTNDLCVAVKLTVKGEDATGEPATLTVGSDAQGAANNFTIHGHDYAISGNGNRGGTAVTINGGTITAVSEAAIYQPQDGTLTINGGTITGPEAVHIKVGTVEVNGGTLTGTAAKKAYVFYSNGVKPTGDALVVDNCNYPTGSHAPEATINGGSFTSTGGAAGIGDYCGNGVTTLASVTATSKAATLADGLAWHFVEAGKYVVAPAVAKIDDVLYATLAEAVEAAHDNDMIVMVANEELSSTVTFPADMTLTLDLNGKTITNKTTDFTFADGTTPARFTFIVNGDLTVKDSAENSEGGINIAKANNATTKGFYVAGGELTVESGSISADYAAAYVVTGGEMNVQGGAISGDSFGIVVKTSGELNVTGGLVSTEGEAAISGNGNADNNACEINISGGTVSGGDLGVYFPCGGTLSISDNAVISGDTGVYVKAGALNITGGTINGTRATAKAYENYDNGGKPTGDALVIDNCAYPNGFPNPVSITGGIFVSTAAKPIGSYISKDDPANPGTVTENGRILKFVSAVDVTVSAPEFSSPVDDTYCADNFVPTYVKDASGYYTIKVGSVVARVVSTGTGYGTLQEALDAVNTSGTAETVTLLANVSENVTVVSGQNVTLDLNGKIVTGNIANNGILTVKSSAVDDESKPVVGKIVNTSGTAIVTSNTLSIENTVDVDATTALQLVNQDTATDINVAISGGVYKVNKLLAEEENVGTAYKVAVTGGTFVGGTWSATEFTKTPIDDFNFYLFDEDLYSDLEISGGIFSHDFDPSFLAAGKRLAGTTVVPYGDMYKVESSTYFRVIVSSENPQMGVASGSNRYPEGEDVTVTATPTSVNYVFIGWYENGTLVSNSARYTFTVTAKRNLVAKFAESSAPSANVNLTVSATKFTITGFDNDPDGTVERTHLSRDAVIGQSYTLTYRGTEDFLYWENAQHRIMSRTESFTFAIATDTNIHAVVSNTTGSKEISFVNISDQVLFADYFRTSGTTTEMIKVPNAPSYAGAEFAGWSINGEGAYSKDEVAGVLVDRLSSSDDKNFVVKTVYNIPTEKVTINIQLVTVSDGKVATIVGNTSAEGKVGYNSINLEDSAIPDGMNLHYWLYGALDVGSTVSELDKLSTTNTVKLRLISTDPIALTVVIGSESSEIAPTAAIQTITSVVDNGVKKLRCVASFAVPEEIINSDSYRTIETGILRIGGATNAQYLNLDQYQEHGAYIFKSNILSQGTMTYNSKMDTDEKLDTVWYYRAYMTYEYNGVIHTVYSSIQSMQYSDPQPQTNP